MNNEYETTINLGYTFHNGHFLRQALTHSSYAHENHLDDVECNERLEFLGDAVLELIVSDYLYKKFVSISEGELTKFRARLVCEPSLAGAARQLHLGHYIRLGHGESATGGRERDSILSDAFEAVIGAIYSDGGFENARDFVHRCLLCNVSNEAQTFHITDYKSYLQELLQKNGGEPATYTIIDETGPAHQKNFTAAVSHEGRQLGTGVGKTKKEAEQNAAQMAVQNLRV